MFYTTRDHSQFIPNKDPNEYLLNNLSIMVWNIAIHSYSLLTNDFVPNEKAFQKHNSLSRKANHPSPFHKKFHKQNCKKRAKKLIFLPKFQFLYQQTSSFILISIIQITFYISLHNISSTFIFYFFLVLYVKNENKKREKDFHKEFSSRSSISSLIIN